MLGKPTGSNMSDIKKPSKAKALLAILLVFGPALILIFISTRGCEHKFQQLDDYGQIKNYSFVDAAHHKRNSKEFLGDIVLITTLQITCPENCAISQWHLNQMIYQHIRKNSRKKMKQVRIISFVTDGKGQPIKDLSPVVDALKDQVEAYDPKLWIVATGDVRSIYDMENNGQSLLKKGSKYYGGEAFQELLLLADKKHHLRMVLPGTQEGLIRRMKESIALLQKQYDKTKKQ